MCRRTTFDDLRNRPNYLAALNLAARTPGLRGLLKAQASTGEDLLSEEEEETKQEQQKQRSAAAAADLFGPSSAEELSQEDWNTVMRAMKVIKRFNVDGLVSTKRGEIFHVSSKFPKDDATQNSKEDSAWDMDASSSLHAWLTEGQVLKTSLTLPPTTNGLLPFTSPSRAALEAALAKSWPARALSLPRGPLDIFHPKQE